MMAKDSLPERIDAFELELSCIEALIDILYYTPATHEYHVKYMEELHSHRLKIREHYDDIRTEVISAAVGSGQSI